MSQNSVPEMPARVVVRTMPKSSVMFARPAGRVWVQPLAPESREAAYMMVDRMPDVLAALLRATATTSLHQAQRATREALRLLDVDLPEMDV